MDLLSVLLAKQLSGNGDGGNFLVLHCDMETYELDKTWQEIHDAVKDGKFCVIIVDNSTDGYTQIAIEPVTEITAWNGDYTIVALGYWANGSHTEVYVATAPEEKPIYSYNG